MKLHLEWNYIYRGHSNTNCASFSTTLRERKWRNLVSLKIGTIDHCPVLNVKSMIRGAVSSNSLQLGGLVTVLSKDWYSNHQWHIFSFITFDLGAEESVGTCKWTHPYGLQRPWHPPGYMQCSQPHFLLHGRTLGLLDLSSVGRPW